MNRKDIPDGEWRAFATAAFGGLAFVLTVVAIVIVCLMLSGCTATRYVEVPGPTHTDTVRTTRQQRDSIHVRDSIYVSERQQGDTILLTTVRWHTQWRERLVRDTFRLVSIDSIPYRVEVPVEVPAKLTYWQRLRMQTGDISLIALALFLGYGALKIYQRIKS